MYRLDHSSNGEGHCSKVDILGDTIENSSVYLFPFIIEFSMIGAHIVYNMWKNVGNKPTFSMVGEHEVEEKGKVGENEVDEKGILRAININSLSQKLNFFILIN